MGQTSVDVRDGRFLINGSPTYTEVAGSRPEARGLLMNARFIQGIFDDGAGRGRYARWGRDRFDPEEHTSALIAALPEWHRYGLRAFTVGFQGGGPCFTVPNPEIDNNPFGADGGRLDPAYAGRMDRLIRGANAAGMVVIVSYLYQGQVGRLEDGRAVRRAVTAASRFLREGGYTNVLVEVANENDTPPYAVHPIVHTPEGMASLIDLARVESGGLAVGCSGGGGSLAKEIVQSSDIVLFHGNGRTRQQLCNMVRQIREWAPGRAAVCNEDSQALGNMQAALDSGASWGYFNNMTKQEPPADWRILPGEDRFFALRMAMGLGIRVEEPPEAEQYYLAGFEPAATVEGQRWIRLATLYPERVDRVVYYRNGSLFYTAYDEPFPVHYVSNWRQQAVTGTDRDREWRAVIHLADGRTLERVWRP
jgi:hypothetical protein